MPCIIYKYGNAYISAIPTLEWNQLIQTFGNEENLSDKGQLCIIYYKNMCDWLKSYEEDCGLLDLHEFLTDVKEHMENENCDNDIYLSKENCKLNEEY